MLTQVSNSIGVGQKQISVRSSTSSEVMYIVPDDRKFEGFIAPGGTNSTSSVSINGQELQFYVSASGGSAAPYPITLLAGSTVTCTGSGVVTLIGIES